MQKVIIIATGETKEVTNNEAHGLIESGIAKIVTSYKNRMMEPAQPPARADEVSREGNSLRSAGRLGRKRGYRIK